MPMMHSRERILHSGSSLRNLTRALTALAFVLVSTAGYAQTPKQPQQIQTALPQGFEPNHGQADQKVDFISTGPVTAFCFLPKRLICNSLPHRQGHTPRSERTPYA